MKIDINDEAFDEAVVELFKSNIIFIQGMNNLFGSEEKKQEVIDAFKLILTEWYGVEV